MSPAALLGHILDEKYRIDSELGRGGMGTVYLATHIGTERPVAVKVISPQYMQRPEFVERFRREARAAGRLRHPNVVNVTDFGFADTEIGTVAYLVMEYLDGCTLGEVLEEEKNLPIAWTLDILEQVCSAVHEAHSQGIIHRDLKPDNIWLEPNQRGGYTVKVLDFGIAKLEATPEHEATTPRPLTGGTPTSAGLGNATMADHIHGDRGTAIHDSVSPTLALESATLAIAPEGGAASSELKTLIQPVTTGEDPEVDGTRTASQAPAPRVSSSIPSTIAGTGAELTRVGSVLGTPLYMSPEQCRGERLDARSDVYSLGVIAYQMLAGRTPFAGDFTEVMRAHRELPPPPLNNKKVRAKLKRVIGQALAKDPDDRPQSAEAFATTLRARSEGIFGLLRRSAMIYTEHIGTFVTLALLLFSPFIVATLLNSAAIIFYYDESGSTFGQTLRGAAALLTMLTGFFCGYLIAGTTTWLVNQMLSLPLRPVSLRPALKATRRNWKRLVGTGILATVLTFLGYALFVLPGLALSVLWALVGPVVMMEHRKGFAALRRSKELTKRSLRTTAAAVAILFLVPMTIAAATGFFVALTVKSFADAGDKIVEATSQERASNREAPPPPAQESNSNEVFKVTVDTSGPVRINDTDESRSISRRIREVLRETLTSLFMLPIQILLAPLSSIIVALLYMKTRQAGGESLDDLRAEFQESELPEKKWQQRVRNRLVNSGRVTSRPTND